MKDLQTHYSLEDMYKLLEIDLINNVNNWIAAQKDN